MASALRPGKTPSCMQHASFQCAKQTATRTMGPARIDSATMHTPQVNGALPHC